MLIRNPAKHGPRPASIVKWVTVGLLGAAAALAVALVVIVTSTGVVERRVRRIILDRAEKAIDGRIEIGTIDLEYLPLEITVHDVSVSHATEGGFLDAEAVEVAVDILSLVTDEIHLSEVALIHPTVDINVYEGRVVNLPMLRPAEGKGSKVILESLNVSNGLVNVRLERTAPWPTSISLGNLDIDVTGDENKLFELRTLAGSGEVKVGNVTRTLDRLDVRTTLDMRSGGLHAKVKQVDLEMLDVDLSLRDGKVEVDEKGWLKVSGEYGVGCPLSIVSSLLESAPALAGTARCDGTASWAPGAFEVDTGCSGRSVTVGRKIVGDVDVHLLASQGTITLESAAVRQAGGELRFSGSLDLDSETLDIAAKGELDKLRFAELATNLGLKRSLVEFTASGPFTAAGTLRPVEIDGDVDLSVDGFRVGTDDFRKGLGKEILHIGSGHLKSGIGVDGKAFRFKDASVTTGSTLVRTNVAIGFDKTLHVKVDSSRFDASDIENIASLDMKGAGSLDVTIQGPFKNLKIISSLNLRGLGIAGIELGNVSGNLRAEPHKRLIEITNATGARKKTTYTVPSCTVTFRLPRQGGLIVEGSVIGEQVFVPDVREMFDLRDGWTRGAEGMLSGNASFSFSPRRRNSRLRIDAEAIVTDLSVKGQMLGSGVYKGLWDDGLLEIRTLELRSDAGSLSVSGTNVPGEGLDLDVHASGVNSARIAAYDLEKIGLKFSADLDAHVSGTSEVPVIEGGLLTFGQTSYRGQPFEDSTIAITLSDRVLRLEGSIAGGTISWSSSTETEGEWTTKVDIGIADLRLAQGPLMIEDLTEAEAAITGAIAARVSLAQKFSAKGEILLDKFHLSLPEYSVVNDGALRAHFTEKTLVFDRARFAGEGTRIKITGRITNAGPRMEVEGQADLGLLSRFIPKVKTASGSIEPRVSFAGTWKSMDVQGEVDIDCENLEIRSFPVDFTKVSGKATFTEGGMAIDISGNAATGTFQAAGGIRMAGFKPSGYDLYSDFNDVSFRIMDDVPITIEGRLALQGNVEKGDKPLLSGDVWLTRFRYKDEFKLASVEDIAVVKPTAHVETYDVKKESIRLDVLLHGYENLRVSNNIVDARFRIDETQQAFRVVGTDARPVLLGSIMVTRGTVVWQKRTYEITRGVIDFTSMTKTDAHFDIVARGDVRDWRLTLQAVGTPEDFKVIVNSVPALSDEDIVCLLASDMTCEEAAEGLGFIGAYGLNELLGQFASMEQFQVVPVYDPDTGKAEPMVMLKQKLTDKFSVSALSSLGANQQTGESQYLKATIAYKVNDSLSIEGFYDTKHAGEGSNVGNIGIDLSWRIEF